MKLKFILRCLPERTKAHPFNYAFGKAIVLKPRQVLDHHTHDSIYFADLDTIELNRHRWSKYILKQIG